MAHADEVPDRLKNPGHTIPKDEWEKVRADVSWYAALEAPPSEDDEDDVEFLKWL